MGDPTDMIRTVLPLCSIVGVIGAFITNSIWPVLISLAIAVFTIVAVWP